MGRGDEMDIEGPIDGWDKMPVCRLCFTRHATNEPCDKGGKMEHIDDESCWCEPELNYEDPNSGNQVWVHRETH